jgi:hypothetical protein
MEIAVLSALSFSALSLSVPSFAVAVPHTPPTPAPSIPPPGPVPGGCTPGRDGIPAGPFGHLICGDYGGSIAHAPAALWHAARVWWPLLLTVAVCVLAARLAWAWWRRHTWRRVAEQAVWLEVVPPVTATPAATLALWRLLATLLPAARRWTVHPRRMVWEVHATTAGMRAGLWLPPGANPTAVLRVLRRAWPGVRAEQTAPPKILGEYPAAGVTLRSAQPDWLPLVDDPEPPRPRRWEYAPPEDDRIRAVFDGLAAAGRTGGGLLQVHVARAPRHRVAMLRRATVDPRRVRRQRGGARLVILALEGLRALLSGLLDFITPNPPTGSRHADPMDPVVAEQARQARAKHGQAPHLLVAIRAFATGPTTEAARAAAADITSGYTLLSAHWRPRRLWQPVAAAHARWVPEGRMQLATVAETAALAGLPAEPSAYGLPAAPSRRLPPNRDTFAPSGPALGSSRPVRRPPGERRESGPVRDDDSGSTEDEPMIWSTP